MMNIRCRCGNEVIVSHGSESYLLRKLEWFDVEKGEVRCPKCRNNNLAITAIGSVEAAAVRARLDIFAPQRRCRQTSTQASSGCAAPAL
jgi:phage FluMu protein Com